MSPIPPALLRDGNAPEFDDFRSQATQDDETDRNVSLSILDDPVTDTGIGDPRLVFFDRPGMDERSRVRVRLELEHEL